MQARGIFAGFADAAFDAGWQDVEASIEAILEKIDDTCELLGGLNGIADRRARALIHRHAYTWRMNSGWNQRWIGVSVKQLVRISAYLSTPRDHPRRGDTRAADALAKRYVATCVVPLQKEHSRMSETVQFEWRDAHDGWTVATVQGHELKLRRAGPHDFEFSIDGQGNSVRLGSDNPVLTLQMALERTALKLPPR